DQVAPQLTRNDKTANVMAATGTHTRSVDLYFPNTSSAIGFESLPTVVGMSRNVGANFAVTFARASSRYLLSSITVDLVSACGSNWWNTSRRNTSPMTIGYGFFPRLTSVLESKPW